MVQRYKVIVNPEEQVAVSIVLCGDCMGRHRKYIDFKCSPKCLEPVEIPPLVVNEKMINS